MSAIKFFDLSGCTREESLNIFNLIIAAEEWVDDRVDVLLWLGPSDTITPLYIQLNPSNPSRVIGSRHEATQPTHP